MEIYLLLGGNIGPVRENLQRAQALIAQRVGRVTRASRIYTSPAWGFESPDPFFNVALAVETALSPDDTMQTLLEIEHTLGRRRDDKGAAPSKTYASRPIDIDILFFGPLVLNTPLVTVPHPRLPQRRFALLPLCDIAPDFLHPQLHQTISDLLSICPDHSAVVPVA